MVRLKALSRYATSVALVGGLGFFAWLVYKIGTGPILDTFRDSSRWIFAIALVYGLFQAAYCCGWSLTLSPRRIPFPRLLLMYQAGDTVSYAFPMAGEAMKVGLLRPDYPTIQGLFSVSVTKFCEFVAQLLFYLIGVTLTLFAFPLPGRVRATGVALSTGLALGLAVLFRMQRKGLYGPVLRLAEKVIRSNFSEETRQKVLEVDRMISRFYVEDPARFAAVVFCKLVGKLGGVVEAALVLLLLGHRPTVALAFAVETLSMLVNDIFFFIPGRVGGAEGGRTVVFMMLGYTAAEGLTYAVIRRVRELFWIGIGLVYLIVRRFSRGKSLRDAVMNLGEDLEAPVGKNA
jgi:glycosyltransferase 2 family protein